MFNRLFRLTSKTSKLGITDPLGGIHRWPDNSPHKRPTMRKAAFPCRDVIIYFYLVDGTGLVLSTGYIYTSDSQVIIVTSHVRHCVNFKLQATRLFVPKLSRLTTETSSNEKSQTCKSFTKCQYCGKCVHIIKAWSLFTQRSLQSYGLYHYGDVIWASWRLKPQAIRQFIQQFAQDFIKENFKAVLLALCEGNPPVTGGFPSQRTCDAEEVSISWRHHVEVRTISQPPPRGDVGIVNWVGNLLIYGVSCS